MPSHLIEDALGDGGSTLYKLPAGLFSLLFFAQGYFLAGAKLPLFLPSAKVNKKDSPLPITLLHGVLRGSDKNAPIVCCSKVKSKTKYFDGKQLGGMLLCLQKDLSENKMW